MSRSAPRVVVVGGGITGLVIAYRLESALPRAQITLCESSSRLGGKIATNRIQGFVIERGADSFLASKPAGAALCRDIGIASELQGTIPRARRSFILWQGTLHPLPEGLTGLVPSRLELLVQSSIFSAAGKERLLGEPEIPAALNLDDESLGHFVRRRFGDEAYERMIEPLMAGIYAGDGECLSLAATFPQLSRMEREHGSIIAAARANSAPSEHAERSGFLAPRDGMGTLVDTLSRSLHKTHVRLNASVEQLARVRDGFSVKLHQRPAEVADAVIFATPAYAAASALRPLDASLTELLNAIPYVSTLTVSLAYRHGEVPHTLDGYGFVVPRQEGSPLLACTWTSSKWAGRAPANRVLLRGFVGRAGQEELSASTDVDVVALVRRELSRVLAISATPSVTQIDRWPRGMPQYTLGHPERLAKIDDRLAHNPGVFLAGHAYRGVGIPDCIQSANDATNRLTHFFEQG